MTEIDNRFTYHSPTGDQPERYAGLRERAKEFAHLIDDYCPDGAEKAKALDRLDEAVMWANAAISRCISAPALPECVSAITPIIANTPDHSGASDPASTSLHFTAACPEHPSKMMELTLPKRALGEFKTEDLCRSAGCPKMRKVAR